MSNKLGRDITGAVTYTLMPSKQKYSVALTQNLDTTLTLPTNEQWNKAWDVFFSYSPGAEVWVAVNEVAAVPAGASFALTTSELMPAGYRLLPTDIIHVFTADTSVVMSIKLMSVK